MGQKLSILLRKIESLFQFAERAERECSVNLSYPSSRPLPEPDEELDDALGRLENYTRSIFRDLRLLAEALNLGKIREEIVQAEKSHGNLQAMELDTETPQQWSVALRSAHRYFDSLKSLADSEAPEALAAFHNMIDKSGQMIADLNLTPKNETQVRNAILKTVKYAFPDARKEKDAPNLIANFRMDVAVPSLKAVAEYKFADTPEEVNKCLEGIYADMVGYGGSDEWQHFFAVIYMTGQYVTQRQVEQEFKRLSTRASWTPVVVVGPGERV